MDAPLTGPALPDTFSEPTIAPVEATPRAERMDIQELETAGTRTLSNNDEGNEDTDRLNEDNETLQGDNDTLQQEVADLEQEIEDNGGTTFGSFNYTFTAVATKDNTAYPAGYTVTSTYSGSATMYNAWDGTVKALITTVWNIGEGGVGGGGKSPGLRFYNITDETYNSISIGTTTTGSKSINAGDQYGISATWDTDASGEQWERSNDAPSDHIAAFVTWQAGEPPI